MGKINSRKRVINEATNIETHTLNADATVSTSVVELVSANENVARIITLKNKTGGDIRFAIGADPTSTTGELLEVGESATLKTDKRVEAIRDTDASGDATIIINIYQS